MTAVCHLQDQHLNMLEFEVPLHSLQLSDIFGQMEQNRQRLRIEDYSVSQTTLDQVSGIVSGAGGWGFCGCT